ncbi:MAG: beta-ketoacyl synthase N-terminal-like domain-containing protein [Myxococcota bacterium]
MADPSVGENDIAIVGMALRVPGADSPTRFWQNLREGVESIVDLDEATLLAEGEDAETLRRAGYVGRGGALDGVKLFDRDFFGFSPKEAAILDPQHRHFMELCWEALEDAGHTPRRFEGPIGVYAGCGMGSYFYFHVCSNRELVDSVDALPAAARGQRQGLPRDARLVRARSGRARASTSRRPARR